MNIISIIIIILFKSIKEKFVNDGLFKIIKTDLYKWKVHKKV